jgi:hypothetical protein
MRSSSPTMLAVDKCLHTDIFPHLGRVAKADEIEL